MTLAAQGVDKIDLQREVPEMIEVLRSTYKNVEFSLEGPIGEHESVVQAIATASLQVAGLPFA